MMGRIEMDSSQTPLPSTTRFARVHQQIRDGILIPRKFV